MEPEDTPIVTWTIYEKPEDHPTGYVIRQWLTVAGETQPGDAWKVNTLEEARQLLPAGSTKTPFTDEDPIIVGTWI